MKKITIALAGLLFAGSASAIQLGASGIVAAADCLPLNEDVRINLTTGVVAGVTCNATAVAMAACHTGGRVSSRSVGQKQGVIGQDANGNDITGTITCAVTAADPACVANTVSGPAMAFASSGAGTATTLYPAGACTAATAEARALLATP